MKPNAFLTGALYLVALLCPLTSSGTGTFRPDHSLLDGVLKDYVKSGVVNYKAMKRDNRLPRYIDYIKKIDTASIAPTERLAFWINAYNAWTLKVVVDNYPLNSIKDLGADLVIGTVLKKTIWDKEIITMNRHTTLSLNNIEHDIIRQYRDARIHFAIVCAARSCPPLRTEAYTGEKLSAQLDAQTRMFLSDTTRNKLDIDRKTLTLSKIFSWFEDDFATDIGFGKRKGSVVKFIARYVPGNVADALLDSEKEFEIEYLEYDWSLNE